MNDFNKEIFDIYLDKLTQEACKNQETSQYAENKRKREAIYKEITKDIKFISKFVKKCQSLQTGEKTVFYDIDIKKMPISKTYGEFSNQFNHKYDILRGRSINLSMYVAIKQEMMINNSIRIYIIPAVKWAYENYVIENFCGKEIEFEGEKYKAFQIDWFDEVYVAKEKIKTTFQKKIEEIEEKYRNIPYCNYYEKYHPESWERAWIDYVERYDIHEYLYNCKNMRSHPKEYPHIKNHMEYLKTAEKILHKKFI